MSNCLHQISEMKGIPNSISNAVRAAAFLVGEMEENAIHEVVREAVVSQINELAQDLKDLVEDTKEKISNHVQLKISEIAIPQPTAPLLSTSTPTVPHTQTTPARRSYADSLIYPPPHANPKLAAREGIRARQIMLEGINEDSKHGHLNGTQLKSEFNKILGTLGLVGKGVRSATILKNRGVLVEMDNDSALAWIQKEDNSLAFRTDIGADVVIKPRTHMVIAFNAPLTLNPDDPAHTNEIRTTNNIDDGILTAIRWIKPPARRSLEQKSAHLFLSFTDAKSANRVISEGLMICNKRVRAEKVKREPTRCLKCQGWNHHAYECTSATDVCGNCAGEHRTNQCPAPHSTKCVSCGNGDHPSWSRACPTYLRKVGDCDSRNPENTLHFFPTEEPWTWTAKLDLTPPRPPQQPQQQQQQQQPKQKNDTYRPNYESHTAHTTFARTGDSYRPSQRTHERNPPGDPHRPPQRIRTHDSYRPDYQYRARVENQQRPAQWRPNLTATFPDLNLDVPPSKSWDDDTPIYAGDPAPPPQETDPIAPTTGANSIPIPIITV
jgi:hypothetical protein